MMVYTAPTIRARATVAGMVMGRGRWAVEASAIAPERAATVPASNDLPRP